MNLLEKNWDKHYFFNFYIMQVKAWLFDRAGQSFVLLKNNFMDFFLPLFLYNLISVVVVWTILIWVFFSNIWNIMNGTVDFFSFLNNSYVVISMAIWMVAFIVYLVLYIPILLGLIKGIKQALEQTEVTTMNNLIYWFSRLTSSFKTYWYIFSYVALIPALLFILGWVLFNTWFYFEWLDVLQYIWGLLMILWWWLFLIFALYRWVKAHFALYSAVNHDSFKKDDFLNSVIITDSNWFRIVWNYLLIWLIVSLISWIIWWLFKIFSYSWIDFTSIKSIEDIVSIAWNFSVTTQILSGFINNIINTIWAVFIIIFTYLFFIRLKSEAGNIANTWKIEL